MNKVCFWTFASEQFEQAFGNMSRSLAKFHPDIPLIKFTYEDIAKLGLDIKTMNIYPHLTKKLGEEYEKVIHIDSDILVCSSLVEVLEDDFDVATILDDDEHQKYFNLGFCASTSKEFNNFYSDETNKRYKDFNDGEQGVLNDILKNSKFKVKCLDHGEGSYCTSVAYSLNEIKRNGDMLFFRGKPIRIIHMVAHWNTPLKQLDFTGEVNDDVLEFINYLES
jgi:lipopolysaccharide biosynthesis glycosyltransferase